VGGNGSVVAEAVAAAALLPVGRDRAVHHVVVVGRHVGVSQRSPGHLARAPVLDDDVGPRGEHRRLPLAFGGVEVEDEAALAAVPDAVGPRLPQGRSARRLDEHDLGAVVGQQHRGDRPRHAARQIEDAQTGQRAGRRAFISGGDRHASPSPCEEI